MLDRELARLLSIPAKRSVFISYHHDNDQVFKNEIARLFEDEFPVIEDNSLTRALDSDDPQYVMRRIRETHISGTSCTIVLCGAQSRWRKYIDWEIKATLDKSHGLIGVLLPTNPVDVWGAWDKPDRLQDNLDSGYAIWTKWSLLCASHEAFRHYIEVAVSRPASLINNTRPLRSRNG